jgi:hypothetical protein
MSDPIEIPVAEDTPLYSERITLDGRDFLFEFDWNDREGRWYLSIRSVSGSPLVLGIKIVANWPLLHRFTNPDLPPGNLFASDLSPEAGESPGFLELGKRVRLLYFTVS